MLHFVSLFYPSNLSLTMALYFTSDEFMSFTKQNGICHMIKYLECLR